MDDAAGAFFIAAQRVETGIRNRRPDGPLVMACPA
jgi:hypothetical protein